MRREGPPRRMDAAVADLAKTAAAPAVAPRVVRVQPTRLSPSASY